MKKMSKFFSRRTVAAGLMATAVAFSSAPAMAADTIKVGVLASLSGPLEVYGKQMVDGFKLGMDYATQGSMQVDGKNIELVIRDTQGKPDHGKQAITSLFQDEGVDIAVGGTSSGVTLAMLPVAKKFKKVLVVEPAVAHSITGENWNRYIFRTGRNSDQDAVANAVAIGGEGVSIATLAQDYSFGRDFVESFKGAVEKSGGNFVHSEYVPLKTTDFTAPANRIFKQLKGAPGKKYLFVVWAGAGDPMTKIKRMKPEKRYDINIASGGNILAALKAFKKFEGMEGATYYYHKIPDNPMNDWLVAAHEKQFNSPPDFFTAGGMSAASAVLTALKAAKSTDSEKLISAMEGMEFETPKGTMQFRGQDHQAMQSMYHFRSTNFDGVDHGVPVLVREVKMDEMDIPIRNQQ